MATTPLRVDGADVSHHQGELDLKAAKAAGLKWLYHKATEGTTFRDSEYASRREQARAAKLPFGAYHFARPELGDAAAEARAFLAFARPVPGDLLPCLDLEVTGGLTQAQLKTWARNFSRVVKARTGVLPVLYCPWDLGLPNLRWVPRYNDRNQPPTIPWDIWQFSNGQLGIPNSFKGLGRVDLNHSKVGVSKLLIPKPKPEPEPATEVHIHHASAQWRDTNKQSLADYRAALKRGAHVTTFTETSRANGNLALLRKAAKETGHKVFWFGGGQALAVRKDVPVKDAGGELVNKAQPGKPPHDGHSVRYAAWVRVDIDGEDVFVVTGHWVTGHGKDASRTAKHELMSRRIAELVRDNAKGTRLAFATGDINAPDVEQDGRPAWSILEEAGLTTIWDELDTHPSTHGAWDKKDATIDFTASFDPDVRVSADRVVRYRQRFSDHIPFSAFYKVEPPAAAGAARRSGRVRRTSPVSPLRQRV